METPTLPNVSRRTQVVITVVNQARPDQGSSQIAPSRNQPRSFPMRPPPPPGSYRNRGNSPLAQHNFPCIPSPLSYQPPGFFHSPRNIPSERSPRHCRCSRCTRYNTGPPNPTFPHRAATEHIPPPRNEAEANFRRQQAIELDNLEEVELVHAPQLDDQQDRLEYAEFENDLLHQMVKQQKDQINTLNQEIAVKNELFSDLQQITGGTAYLALQEQVVMLEDKIREQTEFMRAINAEFEREFQKYRGGQSEKEEEELLKDSGMPLQPALVEKSGPHQITIKRKRKQEDTSDDSESVGELEGKNTECGICGKSFPVKKDLLRHFNDEHFNKSNGDGDDEDAKKAAKMEVVVKQPGDVGDDEGKVVFKVTTEDEEERGMRDADDEGPSSKLFCKRCFGMFPTKKKLGQHFKKCLRKNMKRNVKTRSLKKREDEDDEGADTEWMGDGDMCDV